jgi:predicted alpha/beta hydrolase
MAITEHPIVAGDGVTNTLQLARANAETSVSVVCLPAMGVPARKYHALIEQIAACGINAACIDLRGHGHSSVRASRQCDFSYAEIIEDDTAVAVSALSELCPETRILLMGHSLGGQMAALALARSPTTADGLILTASSTVYYKRWPNPKRWGLLILTQLAVLISRCVGYFPGRRLGFAGREARGVVRDWAYSARNGKYNLSASTFDYESALAALNVPVLEINFSDDDFAPKSATHHLLQKMSSLSKLASYELSGADLGLKKADHFNWMKQPEKVNETIVCWVKSHFF